MSAAVKNKQKTKKLLCFRKYQQKKKEPTEWEQLFAKHLSHKRLVFRMYLKKIQQKLLELNNTKINNPIKKLARGVPVVAQWLTNPTTNHEVAGSVPALAQWVKEPALP